MKTIEICHFKTHALQLLNQVAKNREKIVITKRCKPLVRVIPFHSIEEKPKPGQLADAFVFEKEIISPLGEDM